MRHHLQTVRMTFIKKSTNNNFGKNVEKRNSYTLLVRMYISEATMEKKYKFFSKNEK